MTLSDLGCCLYSRTGLPPVPSSLTTLGRENLSRNSLRGIKPPELVSAVASRELGNDFGSEVPSPLEIVENSPFEDILDFYFTSSRFIVSDPYLYRR